MDLSYESNNEQASVHQETDMQEQNMNEGGQCVEQQQELVNDAETQTPEDGASEQEVTREQQLEQQLREQSDRLLRTMAEYDNFRKRSQREKESIYPQATAAAVLQFLPVADAFSHALSAPCADAEYKKGVEMIYQSFQNALGQLGVEEFGAPGDAFDPQMHNAVARVEDSEYESGKIAGVFQKGYKLGERIIRHAMVQVAN